MADENYPRDLDDEVDPADLAAVEQALAGLDFLRPDGPAPDEPMPEWAWDRLSTALAAETARASGTASSGRSRLARWGGGLVAASVAVVAVGVAVTAFQGDGSGGGAVVAGDAGAPAASVAALSAEAGPERLAFAGISPAQMLVDSDTDYTATGLQTQVRQVLSAFGVGDQEQAKEAMAADAPVEVEAAAVPPSGFLASDESLRDCITKLTADANATALLVDRSTYEGRDAGVVVVPEEAPVASAPSMDQLLVWVVDEDCDIVWKAITLTMRP